MMQTVSTDAENSMPGDLDEEIEFHILHTIRIKGSFARVRFTDHVPSSALDDLESRGLLAVLRGQCILSSAGMDRHDVLIAERTKDLDRPQLTDAYRAFLGQNVRVADACTAWQLSPGDSAALAAGESALRRSLDEVRPALHEATVAASTFGGYTERLDAALEQMSMGKSRYVTDTRIDSFHTVWSELHEEFVATLRHPRETDLDG